MLSETSQTKTNAIWFHLVESKKQIKKERIETELMVARGELGGEMGKMGEREWKYRLRAKEWVSHGDKKVQHREYSQ